MGKLIILLAIAAMACRQFTGKWPWELWFEHRKRQSGDAVGRARNLLGVGTRADRKAILDAHKRLMLTVHPDRGGSEPLVYEANAARDLLLADLGESNR